MRWLVDGTNVVGSVPDGWWRDRPAAFARLVRSLQPLAAGGDDVTVVFDGRPAGPLAESPPRDITVHWAPSADDRLVELVEHDPDPASLTVVTSDRGLTERLAGSGADVIGAGGFRRDLDRRV